MLIYFFFVPISSWKLNDYSEAKLRFAPLVIQNKKKIEKKEYLEKTRLINMIKPGFKTKTCQDN